MSLLHSIWNRSAGIRPTTSFLPGVAPFIIRNSSFIIHHSSLLLAILAFSPAIAPSAELRLKREYQCDGTMITLGDVAEIFAADQRQADVLAAIELFTPPAAQRQRFVRWREIQDLLLLRGVNMTQHRFSGSSQVAIVGGGSRRPVQTIVRQRPLSFSAVSAVNRQVSEAVLQCLKDNVGFSAGSADRSWIVDVELNPDQARLVSQAEQAISITGGLPPWTGLQRFELTVDTPEGPRRFPLDVNVSLPAEMVVAVRPLLRGTVIRDADVELKRVSPREATKDGFHSVGEVVGKETIHAVAKGRILQPRIIRAPLLVRRGEVVTVYARCSGIVVRTTARAGSDGSLGELIAVESLADRRKYYARVSKLREVEVFARPVQASSTRIGPARIGPAELVRQSGADWR